MLKYLLLFSLTGCMTIKESHVHIHPAPDSKGWVWVDVHIQGSAAEDSLNGNTPTLKFSGK